MKLFPLAAASLLAFAAAPANAYEGSRWDIKTHLTQKQDGSYPQIEQFMRNIGWNDPIAQAADTPQARCAAQGKTYYERTGGVSFLGIPLSKTVEWSGCLTDGEAAMAGAGTTTYSQPYRPPTPVYQPPRTCYGTATGYGTYTGTCY